MFTCIESRTWSKPVTSGTSPSSRDKLASAVVGQNIYYFGGFGPKTTPAVRSFSNIDYYNGLTLKYFILVMQFYNLLVYDIYQSWSITVVIVIHL